jgi:hypothetical protein
MAKAYEDYDFNSRNSYATYDVEHLQDSAAQWYNLLFVTCTLDSDELIEAQLIAANKYRAARIRMGLREVDYDG